ncbi:hypothetical protein AHAT_18140 [Agarivorans sp. Toyoura001]|uniref:hypothetical protein n=1 Tax=Agarivorans sp. Toyoura001 TaxID=2283141 RepID=UPI0010DD6C87|nr:hypothetical protein [Agarivorans sp. Toyoura001]GDY25924.1 hypothetical protein AHAT_18140 [Agarivorans sp. Toyoura001]
MKWLTVSFLVIIALVNFGPRISAMFFSKPNTTVLFHSGCFLYGELRINPVNLSYFIVLDDGQELSFADDSYAEISSEDNPIDISDVDFCV